MSPGCVLNAECWRIDVLFVTLPLPGSMA